MRDETAKSKGTCKIQGVACADYGGEILENRSVFRTNPLGGQADRTTHRASGQKNNANTKAGRCGLLGSSIR